MTPTISSLLSRVRAAEKKRLDEDTLAHIIALGEGKVLDEWDIVTGDDGSDEFRVHFSDGSWRFAEYRSRCPDVSTDAAVALVERAGYVIHTIHRSKSGLWSVTLEPTGESEDLRLLPLAILAALLSALEQKESADDPRT